MYQGLKKAVDKQVTKMTRTNDEEFKDGYVKGFQKNMPGQTPPIPPTPSSIPSEIGAENRGKYLRRVGYKAGSYQARTKFGNKDDKKKEGIKNVSFKEFIN